ncbi:MAG TPA: pre-toxin TG domain-containing protein [Pyrinomonadaceae bacterium]|nr:pre-toxin TG domain-containing protein [Pyrinomonadaceae bacterium]
MRTFAQKQDDLQETSPGPNPTTPNQVHNQNPVLPLQHAFGNQAVLQMLKTDTASNSSSTNVQPQANPNPAPVTDEQPPLFTVFVADPSKRFDKRFARQQGQADATRIQNAGALSLEDRQLLNAKLRFFEGDAKQVYVSEIKQTLIEVTREEIEFPAEYARQPGDDAQRGSEDFARRKARDIGARIRESGRVTDSDRLEINAMLNFFTGEAREVYRQEVNETSEERTPEISREVRRTVEELDGRANNRVLFSIALAVAKLDPKHGLRQWALELKAMPHHENGNYLLFFFKEFGGPHVFEQPVPRAELFIVELAKQGVMVKELAMLHELHLLATEEQARVLQPNIRNYPIYDWKIALGERLKPFVDALNAVIHFVPVLGQAWGAIEALYGRQILTGEKLAGWERLLNLIPYTGTILGAGKTGAQIIAGIAKEIGVSSRAILRLLSRTNALSKDVDQLREIKKLVDAGAQLTAEQQQTLKALSNTLKPLEQELEAAAATARQEAQAAKAAKPPAVTPGAPPRTSPPTPRETARSFLQNCSKCDKSDSTLDGVEDIFRRTMSGKRSFTPRPGEYIPVHTRGAAGELDAIRAAQQDASVVRIRVVPPQKGPGAVRTSDLEVDVRMPDGSIAMQKREIRTVTGGRAAYQPVGPRTEIGVTEVGQIKNAIRNKIFPSRGKPSQLAGGGDLVIQVRRAGENAYKIIEEAVNDLNPRLVNAQFLRELHFILPGDQLVKYVRAPNGSFVMVP